MRGKICAFLCAMAVICTSIGTLIPAMDVQAEDKREDEQGFVWQGTTIVGYKGTATEITIPKGATEIGEAAFKNNGQITKVTILEGVTGIERDAFYRCKALKEITIPNSVTYVEAYSFGECDSITRIYIPEKLTSIDGMAFHNCKNVEEIEVDVKNKVYDSRKNCNAIIQTENNELIQGCNKTVIPNGIREIDSNAFYNCKTLENVTIPDNVTSIGSAAFYGCSSLTSVKIPSSVTSIGDRAFYGCGKIEDIQIPDRVTSIGSDTFYGCSSLTSIKIPSSVTSIGQFAFQGCDNLTNVIIPDSVTQIGRFVFGNCSRMEHITISNRLSSIEANMFWNCKALKEVLIPDSVVSIGDDAFGGCSGLESIQVDGSNPIYDSREGCNAIIETASNTLIKGCKTTTIPSSVTVIGKEAFERCDGVQEIVIPESVTTIKEFAFDGCGDLQSVFIPRGVTSIGGKSFYLCGQLESIRVDENNLVYDSRKECNAIIKTEGNILIKGCKNTTIPEDVSQIGADAFSGCGFEEITIPNSVTSIGDRAFSYNVKLKSLTIPSRVTSIGKDIFYGVFWYMGIVIYCEPGSVAQKYAEENRIDFYLHKCMYVEPKSATCIKEGNIAYYVCTLCNKHFSDAGTTEIDEESVKILATGVHQNTELRNKKEATTTEKGYTGDVYCVDCGTLISLGDEIPVIETKDDNFEILNSEIGVGAPDAKIEMSVDELKAVLPEGDRQLLVAGDTVSLYLKVKSVSMSDTERLLFEDKKRDYNIAENICIDISLMKKINNGEAIEVTEPLNGEMKISLEIPENLKNTDSAVKRTYKLLRLHEGESEATEIFGAYDVSNGRLVFDTDGFSTYVLAYKDMPKDESNNQNKDDNNENTDKKFNDDSKSDVDETEDDVLDDEQGMRGTNVGSVDNAVGVNVDNKNANANIDANRKMDETEDDEQETNGTDGEHIDNVVENGFAKNAVSTEKIKWVYLLIAIGVVGIVVGCVKKRKR